MYVSTATTVLEAASSAAKLFGEMNQEGADSLVAYTQPSRLQPIVMVDSAIESEAFVSDILQTLTSMFSAYYLQAVAISNKIGDISISGKLDKFNPNRSATGSILTSLSQEDFRRGLPHYRRLAKEAHDDRGGISAGAGRNAIDGIRSADNLAVGKVLEVEFTDGRNKVVIPVTVSLQVLSMRQDILVDNLRSAGSDYTAKERKYQWKAGAIRLIRDIILAEDIIQMEKRGLMRDKDGVFAALLGNQRSTKIAGLASGNLSVAGASAMLVIPTETQLVLERELLMSFKDPKARHRIFVKTALMLVCVVDRELSEIKIYHRGIALPTKFLLRDLKSVNKGTGPDIDQILKAYRAATAPSF